MFTTRACCILLLRSILVFIAVFCCFCPSFIFHDNTQISILYIQACNVVPTDEGLEVTATTQWTESVQQAVAKVCGLKKNRLGQWSQAGLLQSVGESLDNYFLGQGECHAISVLSRRV